MTLPCPRCGAPVEPPPPGAPPSTACPDCGHLMASRYLRETVELGTWHAWAGQRLTWLHDRLLAGDLPAPDEAPGPYPGHAMAAPAAVAPGGHPMGTHPAGGPATAHRPPPTAGSLLLAAGAFLLVVAGIAFLAFTWDLLGPLGQIAVLLLLGVACLTATSRLLGRLRGTATALGVVGTFLVVIAAIGARLLGPDLVGPTASLLVALVVLLTLCLGAAWLRPRSAPVGELAGIAGAGLAVLMLATAPGDDALPLPEPWTWWVAVVFAVGGVLLLVLADRARLDTWPWLGAVLLVGASVAFAFAVLEQLDRQVGAEGALAAAVLLVAAAGVALARRALPHRLPVAVAATVVWFLALAVTWTTSVAGPDNRAWGAAVLAAAGVLALAPQVLDLPHGWVRIPARLLGAIAVGAAVGLLVAPWVDPWQEYLTAPEWADSAMQPWRGLVAGTAVVGVLAVSVALVPRLLGATADVAEAQAPARPDRGSSHPDLAAALPIVPAASALGTWLMAVVYDLGEVTQRSPQQSGDFFYEPQPTPDAFLHQVAIALAVVSLGVLAHVLLRRLPAWAAWLVPALAVPALLMELSTRTVDTTWEPEVVGLLLALPTLVASVSWWWLHRPERSTTWLTIAPPLVLVLLPSTLALLDDATNRWWFAEEPGTAFQVRTVALLAVGVVAAVVGARQRWAGLFFPGLAVTFAVVGVQLVDLGRFLPQWVSFALAGAALVLAGARWEWVRDRGRSGAAWVRTMR